MKKIFIGVILLLISNQAFGITKEQEARLKELKGKYPIGWYEEFLAPHLVDESPPGSDAGFYYIPDCNVKPYDEYCFQPRLVLENRLNEAQIISVFLNYDENEGYYSFRQIALMIIDNGIDNYIKKDKEAREFIKESIVNNIESGYNLNLESNYNTDYATNYTRKVNQITRKVNQIKTPDYYKYCIHKENLELC